MKRLLTFVAFIFFVSECYSQGQSPANQFPVFDTKNMLPTSPEAAILGRFGDIPIGYYTGTVNVSIPLYTVKEAGLDIPITLSYHGSGIKVEDQASNVGLGWSLEPGGSIIQIVNGVEDNQDFLISSNPTGYQTLRTGNITGSYSARPEMGYSMFGCSFPVTPEDDPQTLGNLLLGDGQPDIYMFNFGKFSGKFYIDPETGQPIQLNKNDSIKFAYSGGVWTATTMDGDQYVFGIRETASTFIVSDHTGYTYKLTTIYLHNGKQVQFQYATGYTNWYTYLESYHSTYPAVPPPAGESLSGATPHTDFTDNNTLNLTKIVTSEAIVNFNLEDRQDLIGEADNDTIPNNGATSTKRIRSIDIVSAIDGKKFKSFQFSYSYFPYSTLGGSYIDTIGRLNVLGLRLRLDSIVEVGYNPDGGIQSKPPYRLAYDSSSLLPLKTSFARDFWGYYNGANNAGLIPNLAYFTVIGDPTYAGVPPSLMTSTFSNQRAPDSLSMLAGTLKRITYPTGGYTEFDYSPNSFSNYNYPDAAKLAKFQNQTLVRDRNLDLPQDTAANGFTLSKSSLVHFDCQINRGAPLQGLTFSNMQPAYITLEQVASGVATTIQTWQLQSSDIDSFNANGGRHWMQDIQLPANSNSYYYVQCYLPNSLGPQNTSEDNAYVQCVYSFYDTSGSYKRSLGGGVRIAGIRNYNSDGSIVGHKILRYVNADSSSSGLLMSPLLYYYGVLMSFRQLYPDGVIWDTATAKIWFISSESSIPYSQAAAGNVVGYSRVEEIDVAPDGTRNGLHVYEYNNQPSENAVRMPDNPHLSNGLVSRETILDSQMDTLSQSIYTYSVQGNFSYNGIKIFADFMGDDPCASDVVDAFFNGSFGLVTKYDIYFYPLNTVWYKPDQTISRYYSGRNVLQDTTVALYNTMGQVATSISYNSKGQKQVTRSVYPADSVNTVDPIISDMEDQNLYNNLLFRSTSVNDSETQRMNIYYAYDRNNRVVEDHTERSFLQKPSFVDVTMEKYGSNENIEQVNQRNSRTSFIWDNQNMHVIAEVKNAGYLDINYSSFEQDAYGSWSINPAYIDTTHGFTGRSCYNLSGSLSVTSKNSSTIYIVSYWSQNGPYNVSGTIAGYPVKGKTISFNNSAWTLYVHKVTGQGTITISGNGHIDELRLYPATAQMITHTYDPLIGMTSQTDAGNRVTYYQYDGLARLIRIRDQDYNILKTIHYAYQVPAGCGNGCYNVGMQTFAGTNTLSYPVGVFDIHGKLLGNADSAAAYVSLWNNDTADARVGMLALGQDSMHFNITVNAGQTLLASVTGLRFYQMDLPWNMFDAVRQFNGAYIEFGDGTGMRMPPLETDTPSIHPPNTDYIPYTEHVYHFQKTYYYPHHYPDTSLKTITCYHNDTTANSDFDNGYNPATSLTRLRNLRGNLPQQTNEIGGSCYQQASMTDLQGLTNWNSISSVKYFRMNNGDGANPCLNISYPQDFLAGNTGLSNIQTWYPGGTAYGVGDPSFKLSRLKSDWNTYFLQLQQIQIAERDWNHEDLSHLTQLNTFALIASDADGGNEPGGPYTPIGSTEIDNIINQISMGAGQSIHNGLIRIVTGGSGRTSASQTAVNQLNGMGWTIYIDGILQVNQ